VFFINNKKYDAHGSLTLPCNKTSNKYTLLVRQTVYIALTLRQKPRQLSSG